MESTEGEDKAGQMIDSSFRRENEIPVPTHPDFEKYTPPTNDQEEAQVAQGTEFRAEKFKVLAATVEEQGKAINELKQQLAEMKIQLERVRVIPNDPTVNMSRERQDELAESGYPGVKKSAPEENTASQDQ